MRPIKFRQWTPSGKWHYWGFIGGGFIAPAHEPDDTVERVQKHSQQFTGIYDKKGTEVYEGDIIAEQFENEMGSFQPGTGRIVWCKNCVAFHVRMNDQADDAIEGYSLGSDCEVIGNIYQNSHLLITL
jgi:uncharacterized phage protein (TIGR01671 family)